MTCERGFFNLRGGEGILFFRHFKIYIFISPKCLIMHCIFVLTFVKLLHNSLQTAQAWFHELYVRQCYTRFTHTVCSVYAVYVQYVSCAEAAQTLLVLSHRSLQLIRGCLLQTLHLSIILNSNPNIVTENAFSALWFFFFFIICTVQQYNLS